MQQLRMYRPQARTQDVVVCTNSEEYLSFFNLKKKIHKISVYVCRYEEGPDEPGCLLHCLYSCTVVLMRL